MAKKQDKIVDENHFRIRVDADKHIFPTHKKGGSEALNEIKKQLGSEFGIANVSAHPHHDKSHFRIRVRREDAFRLNKMVSKTNGLEITTKTFQFRGDSIKQESIIDSLLGLEDRVDALKERNDDLLYQLDVMREEYSTNESELNQLRTDYARTESKLKEARAAANNPPRRQVIVEPGKKEIPRLKREILDLEETLRTTKKLDRNTKKYFEYDEKYDNAANETLALYTRAGIEVQLRDVKYLSPGEVLTRNTDFKNKQNLTKTKTSLENRIRDIGNFSKNERETEMGNAEITNEYGEDVVRTYTLGELVDSEEIPDLFTLGTERYLPTKERIHQLTPTFGKKAKDVNKRLTRHFEGLRKLEKSEEHLGGINEQIQYLSKIQEAVAKHSEMIKYRSERDRIKARIENG